MSNPTDKASVAALRTALDRMLKSSACTNGCAPDDMTCDTNYARKVLSDTALSPAQGDGFPVIKIPGHIVNHMEWKDGAIIVTVAGDGMHDALALADDVLKRVVKAHGPSPVCELAIEKIAADIASHLNRHAPNCNISEKLSDVCSCGAPPDHQPGMTDEQANELLADECKKRTDASLWNAAIAAIKRASQGEK